MAFQEFGLPLNLGWNLKVPAEADLNQEMKDSSNPTTDPTTEAAATGQARDVEGFANRKLIRPTLSRDHRGSEPPPERRERANHGRKTVPSEQTHAEEFYYQKQMQSRTPMVVILQNGESLHGTIEWYDKNCIKLQCEGPTPTLVYKASIKYMFKESEERG